MSTLLWQQGRMWCGNPEVTGLPLRLLDDIWTLGPPVPSPLPGRLAYITNQVVVDDDGGSYLFHAFADRVELRAVFSESPPLVSHEDVLRQLWATAAPAPPRTD